MKGGLTLFADFWDTRYNSLIIIAQSVPQPLGH